MRTMEDGRIPPRDLGWGRLAPKLEIVEIPGGHGSMLHAPHVREIAAILRRVLAGEADRTSGVPT